MPALVGCSYFQPYIYRMIEFIRMEKLEIATACLVGNLKNAMINANATPPPPIPATTQRAITNEKVISPAISIPSCGKTFLWIHSSLSPQTS